MILVHCLKPSLRLIEQQGVWSARHLQLNLMNVKNLLHKRTSHRLPLYFILLNQNTTSNNNRLITTVVVTRIIGKVGVV